MRTHGATAHSWRVIASLTTGAAPAHSAWRARAVVPGATLTAADLAASPDGTAWRTAGGGRITAREGEGGVLTVEGGGASARVLVADKQWGRGNVVQVISDVLFAGEGGGKEGSA